MGATDSIPSLKLQYASGEPVSMPLLSGLIIPLLFLTSRHCWQVCSDIISVIRCAGFSILTAR